MNDLELWERLGNIDDDEDLEGLAAMLHALCELAPHHRAPFLGFVDPLLGHSSAQLRGAAVSLLSGTKGHGGLERIVTALGDEEAHVRSMAVRALRKSSGTAPQRWAHAVFHPRQDVRRLALGTEPPRKMESLGTYLRADPELRELARQSPWPNNPCGLVFDMFLRGYVDATEAGDALADAPVADLRSLCVHSVRRTPDFVGSALSAFEGGAPLPNEGRDVLDLWCRIYWACDEQRRALDRNLAEAMLVKGAFLRPRAAFSLLLSGQRGEHLPETLQLAAACHPQMLQSTRLSLSERKTAVIGLRIYRTRLRPIKPALIDVLLAGPLVGSGARFDLTVAALLASFVPGCGIATLRRIASDDDLIATAVATPDAWITLAELPDDAHGGPEWFIPKLRAANPEAATGFIATAAPHWLARS
ncbi:MAG: hypothetical protein KUG77_26655, partial [Nannocystaceae bacterium]|nr:hypothetical protein [Nannocystaceae bacterium]